MITTLLFLNFALMLVMPVVLAGFIASRRPADWGLFGIGAATFVLSQVGHIPFNALVLGRWQVDTAVTLNLLALAIFLGLSAGLFEEVARYLIYRTWARRARSWGQGLMLGAGHGGIEAIILGGLGFYGLMQLVMFQNQPALLTALPVEQLASVQAQLAQLDASPWYMLLVGALERVFALTFHLAASVLVLQAFLRRHIVWLVAAILWHALLDAAAVFTLLYMTPRLGQETAMLLTEIVIGVLALVSLGIIFWLKTPEPAAAEPEPLPAVGPVRPEEMPPTEELLERSKYS